MDASETYRKRSYKNMEHGDKQRILLVCAADGTYTGSTAEHKLQAHSYLVSTEFSKEDPVEAAAAIGLAAEGP